MSLSCAEVQMRILCVIMFLYSFDAVYLQSTVGKYVQYYQLAGGRQICCTDINVYSSIVENWR
jgi:hypothetical protein